MSHADEASKPEREPGNDDFRPYAGEEVRPDAGEEVRSDAGGGKSAGTRKIAGKKSTVSKSSRKVAPDACSARRV